MVRYDILFVFIITRQALFVCVLIHTDHMQVGLRLFLSPVTSNLLLRTAWYNMRASLQSFFKIIKKSFFLLINTLFSDIGLLVIAVL